MSNTRNNRRLFLSNTPTAIRNRRLRINRKTRGQCSRCPQKREENLTVCAKCRLELIENFRIWRTK